MSFRALLSKVITKLMQWYKARAFSDANEAAAIALIVTNFSYISVPKIYFQGNVSATPNHIIFCREMIELRIGLRYLLGFKKFRPRF